MLFLSFKLAGYDSADSDSARRWRAFKRHFHYTLPGISGSGNPPASIDQPGWPYTIWTHQLWCGASFLLPASLWQPEIMQYRRIAFVLAGICLSLACTHREPSGTAKQHHRPDKTPPSGSAPFYTAAHIAPSGSVNAAPLAPGRIATVYGEHLGPAQACHGTADPAARETPNPLRPNQAVIETQVFPTRLCDTEVQVGGVTAGLLYVISGQINFRVPQSVPTSGSTEVRVLHAGRPGPAVSVPLTADAPSRTPEQVADSMWSALQRVSWERRYRPQTRGCAAAPAQPTAPRGGLNGHAYYCAASDTNVTTESLYYPVNPANPKVLLLRADIRPAMTYPEWSVEVEQHLARRLTKAFGTGTVPDNIYEIGASRPEPGLSWRTGKLAVFLHHNRNHIAPAGVRTGVVLIAVREEILAQRPAKEPASSRTAYARELERLFPQQYFARLPQPPRSEGERRTADHRTRTALLRLLQHSEGGPAERAAALFAADDLAVRLGSLLVARTVQNGSESLAVVPDADNIRAQLARLGVRYGDIGHYSGDLEYDRSLLKRAWAEYPDTIWGQHAFLLLQLLGCATSQFPCPGPNCYLSLIEQGEKFLERYPDSPLRIEQIYNLALANDTRWSLSQAQPGDISAEGASVTRGTPESARLRAIEWYEQLLRSAPGTPEARAAEIAIPRLKLKLDTGERSFFCFSC